MKAHELEQLAQQMGTKNRRQKEREHGQRRAGIRRLEQREAQQIRDGKVSSTHSGRALVDEMILPLIDAIEADIETQRAARGSNHWREWYKLVGEELSSRALAVIAAEQAAGAITGKEVGLTTIFQRTGLSVEFTINMNRYEKHDKASQGWAIKRARKARTDFAASNVMGREASKAGVEMLEWAQDDAIKVGAWLIGWVVEVSPHLKTAYAKAVGRAAKGKNQPQNRRVLLLTDEGRELVEDCNAIKYEAGWHSTAMTCAPHDWESPYEGGYLTRAATGTANFVRKSTHDLQRHIATEWPEMVAHSVNVTQRAAHRINRPILDVMKEAYARGLPVFGQSSSLDVPKPAKWDGPAWDELDGEGRLAKQKFDAEQWDARERRIRAQSRRGAIESAIEAAETDKDQPNLYFVHNLDRRGRIYPSATTLSPQGAPFEKALLEAAEGEPIGDDNGPYWLAVEIANCYGEDKCTFDERVEWFEKNEECVVADVANPFREDAFWIKADDPFGFLAAAFAWCGYLIEGPEYVCRTAVSRDGSNSGLQHFSALMCDPTAAERVNVAPTDRPADIYRDVMEVVHKELENSDDELAQVWTTPDEYGDHRVTRKLCKRPVMTFSYSVKPSGMRDQILDELPENWLTATAEERALRMKAAGYLATLVRNAIAEIAPRAAEGMDYLQALCGVALGAGTEMRWDTPLNFPVWQKYYGFDWDKQHYIWEGAERKHHHIPEVDTKAVRTAKNKNAVAPNFIHSLDATHLMMVVARLDDIGTSYMRVVHDSIAVLPSRIDELDYVLRDEFVNLYDGQDWLEDLEAQVRTALDGNDEAQASIDELVAMRKQGDLNLEDVREADYFFA